MKKIIMFVLLFAALKVAGQTTGYLRFDTVKIMKQGGTCELYIINKTKDSLGLLTNVGGGLTRFIKPKMLNDSTIIIGLDTVVIRGASGGQNLANAALTANGNYTQNWAQHILSFDSVYAFKVERSAPDAIFPTLGFSNFIRMDSTINQYPFRAHWSLGYTDSSPDSIWWDFGSTRTGSFLYNVGANGYGLWDFIGNSSNPRLTASLFGSSKLSTYSFGHVAQLKPADSIQLKAVPAATADSVLAIRAYSSGLNTIIKIPASAIGGSGTTDLDTSRTSTTVTITSSTGMDAVIPLVSVSANKAGLISPATQAYIDSLRNGLITDSSEVDNIGNAGERIIFARNDTLFGKKLIEGWGIDITTLPDSAIRIQADSNAIKALSGIGGGSQTIQQVLDVGKTLSHTDTINIPVTNKLYFKGGETRHDTLIVANSVNNHIAATQLYHTTYIDTANIAAGDATFSTLSVNRPSGQNSQLRFKIDGNNRSSGISFGGSGTTQYGGIGINSNNLMGNDGTNSGIGILFDSRGGVNPLRVFGSYYGGSDVFRFGLSETGKFLIGSETDNTVGALQVTGKITVSTHTVGSNSDSAVIWDRSTNEYKVAKINGSGGTTIYSGDGTLAGDRVVTGSNNSLTFDDIFAFKINSDYNTIAKANGTGIYTEGIIGAGNIYEIGYTPVAGIYSKGAGVFIDTNNNVGLGTNPPTTMPLYATGASTFVQGFQSNGANFYKVSNQTADFTASLSTYFYTIDATSGNVTVTLPAASTAFGNTMGINYKFQRIDNSGNTVTIQRAGSDTVNGTTSFTITTQYGVKEVQCTSTSTWAQY